MKKVRKIVRGILLAIVLIFCAVVIVFLIGGEKGSDVDQISEISNIEEQRSHVLSDIEDYIDFYTAKKNQEMVEELKEVKVDTEKVATKEELNDIHLYVQTNYMGLADGRISSMIETDDFDGLRSYFLKEIQYDYYIDSDNEEYLNQLKKIQKKVENASNSNDFGDVFVMYGQLNLQKAESITDYGVNEQKELIQKEIPVIKDIIDEDDQESLSRLEKISNELDKVSSLDEIEQIYQELLDIISKYEEKFLPDFQRRL